MKNGSFAEKLVKACAKALKARGTLKRGWLFPLAKLVMDDIFPLRCLLDVLGLSRLVTEQEVREVDGKGNTLFHLVCQDARAEEDRYGDPPAIHLTRALLAHRRLLAKVPIFDENFEGDSLIDLIEVAAARRSAKLAEEESEYSRWETAVWRERRLQAYRDGRNSAIRVELAWLQLHQKEIVAMLQQHFIPDLATVIFDCLAGHHASHQQAEKEEMLEHEQALEADHPDGCFQGEDMEMGDSKDEEQKEEKSAASNTISALFDRGVSQPSPMEISDDEQPGHSDEF